jgi:hypothetical protein
MAKSIRISDVAGFDPLTAAPSSHGFWEHWFEMQPTKLSEPGTIDEHGIWEKAVSLEILAIEESKY